MKFLTKPKILIFILVLMLIFASVAMYACKPSINTDPGEISHSDSTLTEESASDVSPADTVVSDSEPEPEPEPLPPDAVTIQMGGDVLLHESVNTAAKTGSNTYDFSSYFNLFENVFVSDLNIINLEAPVNAYGKNKTIAGYPDFNMPNEILYALKNINVDLCVTATNHSVDRGYKGLCRSLENIRNAGMDSVGTYSSQAAADTPYIIEINNIKVGVTAFTIRTNGPVKSSAPYSVNICGTKIDKMSDAVLPRIQQLKDNGAEFIIVAMHWGGEYADAPSSTQKKFAKIMCEAGADIVMGSHSHCVQPIEIITVDKGGIESQSLVIYSLGNLFANQTGLNKAKTQEGMIVSAKAVRGEDGIVRLESAFYMPTFAYVRGGSGKNYMKLVPAGEYASKETMPKFFKNETAWKKCKNAWNNVRKTVGSSIESIPGPSSYPDGFFAVDNEVSITDSAQ